MLFKRKSDSLFSIKFLLLLLTTRYIFVLNKAKIEVDKSSLVLFFDIKNTNNYKVIIDKFMQENSECYVLNKKSLKIFFVIECEKILSVGQKSK